MSEEQWIQNLYKVISKTLRFTPQRCHEILSHQRYVVKSLVLRIQTTLKKTFTPLCTGAEASEPELRRENCCVPDLHHWQ